MKKVLLFLLTITLLSCEKESTEESTNGNNLPTTDECAGITCFNGGQCVSGICICPEGYTGTNCQTQVTPSAFRITKVRVNNFPPTDNGAGWDLTTGPDVYVAYGSTCCSGSTGIVENANPPLTFNVNWQTSNPASQFTIWVVDNDDFDSDDIIGGIIFTPLNFDDGFPPQINLNAAGISLTIDVEWIF
jgi:hypothetical protein